MKRPARDFKHFTKGLEGDQTHVKEYLQDCLETLETANAEVKMEDEEEEEEEEEDQDTGEDTDEDDDEESEEDSEEDTGCPRMNLIDIKTAPKIPHLTAFVTVVERNNIKVTNRQQQFMAVVADKTSAVDICVSNRALFDKFKVKSRLILDNVCWSGSVLFLNEKSKVTNPGQTEFDPSLVKEAFGEGEVVSIKEALTSKPKTWFALKGKIVKQSAITKSYAIERKLLTHRQIKLEDQTGFTYVDVWGDAAVNLKTGQAIHMTGCKRKKSESVDESAVTTTRKTILKKIKQTEFRRRYATGTLEEIEVEIYESCPNPRCYHFKLNDNNFCESCQSYVKHPGSYATANVIVNTPRNKIRTLTVLLPQLRTLYKLFDKKIALQSPEPKIQHDFTYLRGKTVKYLTCSTVTKFRL